MRLRWAGGSGSSERDPSCTPTDVQTPVHERFPVISHEIITGVFGFPIWTRPDVPIGPFLSFLQGGPGSVRLRFGDGTVRAVPVFGSGGSSEEGFLCVFSTV